MSVFGLDRARELAEELAREAPRGARTRRRAGPTTLERDRRLHTHPQAMTMSRDIRPSTRSTARPTCKGLDRRAAAAGRPGGARADHRHDRRDRRALRREPRRVRDRGGDPPLLDSPTDKVLWDVGHQAYPHKILTGRRDQLPHDPQVRGPRPVLLDRRVRARHHGRRPRLDLDLLRGRPQGGHAPGPRRGRQGGRGDRRRRAHRRRRVRGAAQRRRARAADRRSC